MGEEESGSRLLCLLPTQLERYSYWAIKEYLENPKRVDSKLADLLIEPLGLLQLTECLFAMKTIDEKERQTMKEINRERDSFIHRRTREKFKRGREADLTYSSFVSAAKKILEENSMTNI